jgi:transposase InsO family protein
MTPPQGLSGHLGGIFSEFEREMQVARVKEALKRDGKFICKAGVARASLGRPKISPEIERKVRTELAKGTGIIDSVGDSYDNALAETINGIYKAEVIHRRGPRRTLEAVEYATLEWVDWFNNRRLLEPIGNVPPAESEAVYYRELEELTPIAA